jgi:hypothetical protein
MATEDRSDPGPAPARSGVPPREAGRETEPAAAGPEHRFRAEGQEWLARPAGRGCYGTGRRGTARLVAVHFFAADAPREPLREILMAAGAFERLREEELVVAWDRATPIERER